MDPANSNSKEMGDIPIELLVSNILSYFDETQLQKLRGVSREWKETIDCFFGQTIRISKSNWEDLKESTSVKSAVVEHWNEDLYPEAEELARGLRELEIRNPEGTMTISNLFPLLAECDNLITLTVHKIYDGECTKNELQSDEIEGCLFPNLKTLKFIDDQSLEQIRYPVYLESSSVERKKMEILSLLMKTLGATKTLKNVDVTMINSHWALPLISLFLVDSPKKERNFPDASFPEIPILGLGVEKLSQLETFILRTHTEGVAISMVFHPPEIQRKLTCDWRQDQRRRQLRKFVKYGYIKETKSPKFNFINNLNMSHLWLDILETQGNLEEIEYEFIFGEPDRNWERFEGILQRNRETLRSLKLFNTSRRTSQSNLWRGSDFSGLTMLESLSLVNLCSRSSACGPSGSPTTKQQQSVELIKDLGNLPRTLKNLELHCPFDARDQENVSSLFKSLSNLETLKLISNENDKPWWFCKEEAKWLLGGKELEVFVGSLRSLKLVDIYWRPSTEIGTAAAEAAGVSNCLLKDLKSSVVAGKKVSVQYFSQYKLKCLQTEREFRRCKITIL